MLPDSSEEQWSRQKAELEEQVAALKRELRTRDLALSHIQDFTYVFDLEGRFLYANQALLSLWRIPLERAVGRNFYELNYPPELAAKLEEQIQQVIRTGQQLRDLTPYTAPDGTTGIYEYIFVPIFGSDGRVENVAGSTRDITERQLAEDALRASEDRFSAAFACAPVGIVVTSPGGEFIEANQAYLDMLGFTHEELAAQSSDRFTHPDDIARTHEYGATLRSGQVERSVIEKRYIRKDGKLVWARATGTMRRDRFGVPAQFIAVIEDITQRRQMEEALRESQNRLQQVFMQSPVAICVLRGRELVFELANPSYEALLKQRHLLGRPLREAIPEVSDDLVGILHEVLDSGVAFRADEFFVPLDRDKDGLNEDYWFNFVYQPLQEADGAISGVVAVVVDVTSQVRARRELERVNRELEEFAYVVSHDLQEPLRMVNIYTELLEEELASQLTPDARQYSERVHAGVRRIEELLQDLLKFSQVQHNSRDVQAGTADLSLVLTRTLAFLRDRIEEQGARIETGPLPVVRGDEGQLIHVLQNLIGNALKYRQADAPAYITIAADEHGPEWVIGVRDRGIGFDPEHAERVFGLFKRLHKDEYPGTGLGLAICKRIIERYGGRIWAESRPGEGATFFFALPKA